MTKQGVKKELLELQSFTSYINGLKIVIQAANKEEALEKFKELEQSLEKDNN